MSAIEMEERKYRTKYQRSENGNNMKWHRRRKWRSEMAAAWHGESEIIGMKSIMAKMARGVGGRR
jgi:hypothetical protein